MSIVILIKLIINLLLNLDKKVKNLFNVNLGYILIQNMIIVINRYFNIKM